MTDGTERLRHLLHRAGQAVVAVLTGSGPAFPERVQHHLVAFEIEDGDGIEEVLAIRSHGSVYNFSNYISQNKRTLTLQTDRGKRVITSNRVVGMTVLESWKGTPPKRTFDSYGDVFERHGWTDRTAYPGGDAD